MSIYTRYLVEGIETGAADLDSDGQISIDELHEYASSKVQKAAPAMKPKIHAIEEGYRIVLAKAPIGDPELIYRKEVESLARQSEISSIGRNILNNLQRGLGLSPERATAIEAEVLKPFQEYQQNLKQYEQVLVEARRRAYSLSNHTRNELKRLQQVLKLRDEDIAKLKVQTPRWRVLSLPWQNIASTFVPGRRNATPFILGGSVIATVLAVALLIPFLHRSQPEQPPEPAKSPSPTETTPLGNSRDAYNQAYDKDEKGDQKGAIEGYTQAIQINRNWGSTNPGYYGLASAYINRGNIYDDLGDKQAAIKDFTQAIQLKPDYVLAYNNRGNARSDLGDKQAAIKDYTQAIQLKPDYAVAYYNRGNRYDDLGDKQAAIKDFTQAIQINRNWGSSNSSYYGLPSAYNNRGIVHRHLGDTQEAIKDYTRAIQLKPDNADAYKNRGIAHRHLGDTQEAIKDYQKAADLYKQQGKTEDYQDALNAVEGLR